MDRNDNFSRSKRFELHVCRELYKNHVAIEVKKAELVVLKEANTSMGDALSVLHTLRDRLQKHKESDKDG